MSETTKDRPNGQSKATGTAVIPARNAYSALRNSMNRLFDDFSMGFSMPSLLEDNLMPGFFDGTQMAYMPKVNVEETEKEVLVTAEIPGIDLKDLEIKLVRDYLVLKGHKKEEKKDDSLGYHRVERTYGAFERSFQLPCQIEEDKVQADYKDGIVKITLPKSSQATKGVKTIKVNAK